MKFLVTTLLSALLAFACGLYLPWWSIALATFIVSVCIVQKPVAAFLSGFIALFLLWLSIAITINAANNGILARRVVMIMGLGESAFMLILLTAILGALVGGLSALTGSLLAVNFTNKARHIP